MSAIRKGQADVAGLLLAKTEQVDLQTLTVAASGGNGEIVKAVLDKGRFTSEQLSDVLVVARQEGKDEVVKVLEAAGAKPPASVQVDEETLKSYVGDYEGTAGYVLTVLLKDGKLTAAEEGEFLDLDALGKTTFRVEQYPGLKLIFNVENGKVTGLTLEEGGSPTQLVRK
jgi:hypothetical protein